MEQIQPLIIGGDKQLAEGIIRELGERAGEALHLGTKEVETTGWQRRRKAQKVWAVVAVASDEIPEEETLANWTNLVHLAFRPARLVVLLPEPSLEGVLRIARAGADGVLPTTATPTEIVRELEGPGLNINDYFPSPHTWLRGLQHASEQMLLTTDPEHQAMRLLRVFVGQLQVGRGRVLLIEGDELRLIAGIGLPDDRPVGSILPSDPPTLAHWVVQAQRPRLVEAGTHGAPATDPDARTSIAVPLIAQEDVLGAVCFSSLEGGRALTTADLVAAEVFASLLAMSITNARLHSDKLNAQRLAAIGTTTASISHCMKNMLMVLNGATTIMRSGWEDNDGELINDGLDMIERASRRLESIVVDLLDFARERSVSPTGTSLSGILDMLKDSAGILCRDRQVGLILRCESDCEAMLDESRLLRALMNLVSNSMDAAGSGGHVMVAARREEDSVVFLVEDSGPGVAPQDLDGIFEAFYSTKGSKGTGLGLAMVRKFCEEHGGTVRAEPGCEFGGLRVVMRLPFQPAQEAVATSG